MKRFRNKKNWFLLLIFWLFCSFKPGFTQLPEAALRADDIDRFITVFPDYVIRMENDETLNDSGCILSMPEDWDQYQDFSTKELKRVAWDLKDFIIKTHCILDCYYYITLNRLLDDIHPGFFRDAMSFDEMTELGQILGSETDKTDEQVLVEGVMGLLKHNPEDLKKVQENYHALRVMFRQINQANFLAQQTLSDFKSSSPRPSKDATPLR